MRTQSLRTVAVGLAILASSCFWPSDSDKPRTLEFKTEKPDAQRIQLQSDSGPAAIADTPQLLSREEIEAGWLCLFDGQTLFGWKANSDANWTVEDGIIRADSGSPGMLMTTTPWADYELKLEYRLEPGGNSGVFLRSTFEPKDPASDCYELNFCDSHPAFPTGSLVGRKKTATPIAGEGEWKSVRVTVEGSRIEADFDGTRVLEFEDDSGNAPEIGRIGLQTNGGRIEFRNVFLRPIGTQAIFNGEDLSGWHEVPGSKSKFDVADGTIHVTNGPGFLEADRQWADFLLQAEARTNGKALNSGIFFRAMPGTEAAPSNGYEMQIQNAFKNGDRSDPVDFGTGAIFRRQKARWVAPDDNAWFSMTLVANGDHFATWVDGVQVVDWTDDRKPAKNPREGRRLEPGHIILQGHDPTTDLNFRNLRIAELPQQP